MGYTLSGTKQEEKTNENGERYLDVEDTSEFVSSHSLTYTAIDQINGFDLFYFVTNAGTNTEAQGADAINGIFCGLANGMSAENPPTSFTRYVDGANAGLDMEARGVVMLLPNVAGEAKLVDGQTYTVYSQGAKLSSAWVNAAKDRSGVLLSSYTVAKGVWSSPDGLAAENLDKVQAGAVRTLKLIALPDQQDVVGAYADVVMSDSRGGTH